MADLEDVSKAALLAMLNEIYDEAIQAREHIDNVIVGLNSTKEKIVESIKDAN